MPKPRPARDQLINVNHKVINKIKREREKYTCSMVYADGRSVIITTKHSKMTISSIAANNNIIQILKAI